MSTSVAPAPATGLVSQLRAFDRVFWICIFMELMERMAYYGVRLVVPVYLVLGTSAGGPGLSHSEKGMILAGWGAMQSWLPTFTGGFSDRFGYKRTIFISVLLKTAGYIGMAMATDFWTMVIGTQLLAAGTGLFKPGIQGTMAHSIAKAAGTESMGWGLFYQSVNIGAAVSAYIPVFTRDVYGWPSLFYACAGIVLSNLVPLAFYEDPKDERQGEKDQRSIGKLMRESLVDLFTSPVLLGFILISSGFWFCFHQFFDMLPNFVDDWTDSTGFKRMVGEALGLTDWVTEANNGVNIPQERLLNLNSLLIMFTMFIFAWLSSKVRTLTSTIVGMGIASLSIGLFINSAEFYVVMAGIVLFTIGEMLSSPKRQEYMASLAPPGKRALYLGYANMPDGIGWVLGNLIAGVAYEEKGDKITLCRRFLVEQTGPQAQAAAKAFGVKIGMLQQKIAGLAPDAADKVLKEAGSSAAALKEVAAHAGKLLHLPPTTPQAEAISQLVVKIGDSPQAAQFAAESLPRAEVLHYTIATVPTLPDGAAANLSTLRQYLFVHYSPGNVWITFIAVGLFATLLMVGYDRWVRARAAAGQAGG